MEIPLYINIPEIKMLIGILCVNWEIGPVYLLYNAYL